MAQVDASGMAGIFGSTGVTMGGVTTGGVTTGWPTTGGIAGKSVSGVATPPETGGLVPNRPGSPPEPLPKPPGLLKLEAARRSVPPRLPGRQPTAAAGWKGCIVEVALKLSVPALKAGPLLDASGRLATLGKFSASDGSRFTPVWPSSLGTLR